LPQMSAGALPSSRPRTLLDEPKYHLLDSKVVTGEGEADLCKAVGS
jgi:hypothetical protein